MKNLDLFHGPNAGYILELYERYRQDPTLVDADTRNLFETWEQENQSNSTLPPQQQQPSPSPQSGSQQRENGTPTTPPPSPQQQRPAPPSAQTTPTTRQPAPAERSTSTSSHHQNYLSIGEVAEYSIPDIVSAARLTRFIREIGHLGARIEPLGSLPPGDPGLDLDAQGLTPEKLADLPASVVRSPVAEGAANALEAIERMRGIYCGSIGYEDDHVQAHEERAWVREAAETRRFFDDFTTECKREILERLTEVESFERFLHQIYPGQKRFSIEGNDMLVPIIDAIIRKAAMAGTHEVVIGMAHRGRLNVLAHVLGKTYSAILAEFQGPNYYNKGTYLGWTGDVKYHLGARSAYREGGIFEMPVTLVPNPSHLEAVNPVVEGRARAVQERRNKPGEPEINHSASLPVLIHGDASFPGQGVVAETLNLSRLKGYEVGGTIHLIINNQIGFTTDWRDSRSTLYASDLAKGFGIPILHVNADDPHACIAAARMAWAYRERFHKDFLIDLVGYRRWGHNEGDEPTFTQPLMYDRISNHPTVRSIWAQKLEQEGVVTHSAVEAMQTAMQNRFQRALREVEQGGRTEATMAMSVDTLRHRPVTEPHPVSNEHLRELNQALLSRPESFKPHARLERLIQRHLTTIDKPGGIEWGHAELLAFATILSAGIPIRLTGQDVERGTFSQRHLVLHDVQSGTRVIPLQQLPQANASFSVYNSPLSENAALGFEYGYSSHTPGTLVLWEAQFGDFCNGAQVVIDQFIISGLVKWGHTPALVLLLPHGYEGQGPEHSSARMERFLQLAADNNIRVVNCTTAAQYFHLLRRQAATLQSDPRPLIVFTPKSLLRNPNAASSLADLTDDKFHPVLPPLAGSELISDVTRLILCSGKVYMDLINTASIPEGMAVARVEELYPFPADELEFLIRNYRNLRDIVWLQEEPSNMGAWRYMEPRLRELASKITHQTSATISISYCGRAESASPAEGSLSLHQQEQARILRDVFRKH
jgi:2-oxoglutarate dehydrogenase E1 component